MFPAALPFIIFCRLPIAKVSRSLLPKVEPLSAMFPRCERRFGSLLSGQEAGDEEHETGRGGFSKELDQGDDLGVLEPEADKGSPLLSSQRRLAGERR